MAKSKTRLVGALAALAIVTVGAFEGVRLHAYRDVVGIPTVCFGETRGVHMGDSYTMEECKAMLGDALIEFEQGIRACMKEPDKVPDPTYVAVLSLSYNIGQRAYCKSTVNRLLNAGDIRGACNAFLMWTKAGGKVIKGLVTRRQEERELCLKGAR
jgi:lysozyme